MITIWVVFAVLTGAAVFSVLWPLARAPKTTDEREHDVAFYKAQTAEIDRDVTRGVIGEDEAGLAKAEAARRLMSAAQRKTSPMAFASPFAVRLVCVATFLFVPVLALLLYGKIGKPGLPDQPLQQRIEARNENMDINSAVAKIERHLIESPDDGRGYEVLAPVYLRMGRADDAVHAYQQAIQLLGASAERYAALGEAQVYAGGGVVNSKAKETFDKALTLGADTPRALYYLGMAAEQDGDKPKALGLFQKLSANSPPNAPWMPAVKERIARLTGAPVAAAKTGPVIASQGAPATAQPDMAATIAAMPADQRQAMIHQMVDGLAQRLKDNGNDLEGWLRLVRAYQVLNEPEKARDALAGARRNFASDTSANQRLDALAHELGIGG